MDKLTDLIPEFYYDLIARVTPGALLCAALVWSVRQRLAVAELDPVIGLPLGLLASYLAGFLLDTASALTLGRVAPYLFRALGKRFSIWQVDVWKHINETRSDGHRAKLVKMMAERAMARSLVTLVTVMWISDLAPMPGFTALAKVGLLIGVIACWIQAEYNSRLPSQDRSSPRNQHA